MSRSYKKVAGFKDYTKGMKRLANKRVRHCKNLDGKGGTFKKVSDSYSITDWNNRAYSKKEIREIKENEEKFYTKWYKWKRK